MADKQPIVNIFGISGPSGNPVQSPAVLYARDDRRWNSFLRQYAVWPNTGNASASYTINRIFDAPYTGTYYIRSSVDNTGSVYFNDLIVNGTTQTIERHHWWWWGGWYGWQGWYGYGGYWGWGGYRTTDWATVPASYPITLAKGINQIRIEVSNSGDVAGFGMTIADTNGSIVWDTRSTAVVSEYTETCGRYTLTAPMAMDIVAYLWGGGGGGGGMDAGSRGGDGAPGQFHKVNFAVEKNDIIEVVVGDGGRAGGTNSGSAPGGLGGASRVNLSGFGSFSGANGSAAGPRPYSGGGGGGGGASLVLVNGVPVAVAGGGGGGGGAGNDGNSAGVVAVRNALTAYPEPAQLYSGASAVQVSGTAESLNGQQGQGKGGDGGGAGGGGGGWGGGAGGSVRGGDSSGYGGQSGGNYPFNEIFKHTPGNVSFRAPDSVTSIELISAVAGGGGGGSGNITQGGAGGGEGARARNLTFNVIPGRLYEICVGDGGFGGKTLAAAYSGQGTITDANLVISAGQDGGFTSIRDTVTDTYILKLNGGQGGNITTVGGGGTVITNTGSGGTIVAGASGVAASGAVGGSGAGPAAGRKAGEDALTSTEQGSDYGCGSAGAGSNKVSIFAVDPNDQTKPQVLSKGNGGKGANGAIIIRWDDDKRLNEDGELGTVSNSAWGSFLNAYGMWRRDNATTATVIRGFEAAYSGTYKVRGAATGTLTVFIDDVQVLTTTNSSGIDPAPVSITLSKGAHQIRFNLESTTSAKGFAVSISDSVDKLYWDTRDNVGTNPPGQNMRYYVSPYARGGTAGQEGANGAVALEIYPRGFCNVKVDGQWRNITDLAVKVAGSWRDVAGIYVKVNGSWKPAGAAGDLTTLIFNQQFGDYATQDRAGLPAPPAGRRRGCKIICTKLHELGYLPDHIYAADELFGEYLRETDPAAYYGYIRWASVVVDWMEKDGPQCMFWIRDKEKRGQAQKELAIKWARRIATPWAQHMAYKMGVEKEDSRAGRAIMKTGLFISRMIGKFSKADKPTKSVVTGYAMWAAFGLFYVLAGLKDKK
jgi:hypothetical protein